jgi:hypothetical protein
VQAGSEFSQSAQLQGRWLTPVSLWLDLEFHGALPAGGAHIENVRAGREHIGVLHAILVHLFRRTAQLSVDVSFSFVELIEA